MGVFREVKYELSYMVFVAGIFVTFLVVMNYFFPNESPDFVKDINSGMGAWMVWAAVLGPLIGIGGGWSFLDLLRKKREFEKLIKVPSKAFFVRNQDRIEYLAWLLSSDYERRVEERKRELKIKE